MITNLDAAAWLAALLSRGISVEARGKRIFLHPKSAFGEMSVEERIAAKVHRAAIITLIKTEYRGWAHPDGATGQVAPDSVPEAPRTAGPAVKATAPTPAPAPEPVVCPYCLRRCVGADHPAFGALHWDDPAERQRRAEDLADQLEARARGWPTARMIAKAAERERNETPEEAAQRELRQRLGWEVSGGTWKA